MAESMTGTPGKPLTAALLWQSIATWSVLFLVFFLLYTSTLRGLIEDWWSDPDYSHGMIVPFVVAYIVFSRWQKLKELLVKPRTLSALGIILASQIIYLVGYFGAEFFLQRSSIVVFLAGVILLLVGWDCLRHLALPLLLLELCIPLPSVLINQITQPLQLIASSASEWVLRGCGLSVYRSGNILQMAHQTLNIGEACSGIRSLVSLVTLAVIMVNFSRVRGLVSVAFVASAAGVAIIANGLRISGAGLLGFYFGSRFTLGYWHSVEGWLVFVVAFMLLSIELKILVYLSGAKARPA
jgi:exosortase